MIFEILRTSLHIKRKASIFLFVQSVIAFMLILSVLSSLSQATTDVRRLESVTGSVYKVDDNFVGDAETQFFAQPDNVDLLKRLYAWEKNNPKFTYIVASHQNVGRVDKSFPSIFEYGYDSGHAVSDTYQSLQINENFITKSSLGVSEGRLFKKNDYSINNDTIPILLGNDYKKYANLHDRFKLYYLSRQFTCEVVGFVAGNSYYNNGSTIQTLDRYIILPSLESAATSVNPKEKSFELKLYLDKCSGLLYSGLPANSIQTMFTEKCVELDITPYLLEGVHNFYLTMWGLEGKQLQNLLLLLAALITTSSILCLSINMAAKIMALKKNYAIYIANGVQKKQLYLSIFLEIAILNCISLLSAAVFMSMFGIQISLPQMTILFFALCLFSCVYPFIVFKKLNLSKVLRGDE